MNNEIKKNNPECHLHGAVQAALGVLFFGLFIDFSKAI